MNGISFSILVVEDDEDDREILDDAFMDIQFGAEVKKFINGHALLHYLESVDASSYPLLIVLDHSLPGMGAPELLQRLKKDSRFGRIPVIVYSTVMTDIKKAELMELGAEQCMQKGRSLSEIHQLVQLLKDRVNNQNRA